MQKAFYARRSDLDMIHLVVVKLPLGERRARNLSSITASLDQPMCLAYVQTQFADAPALQREGASYRLMITAQMMCPNAP
jgi:hypothetical protein